MREELNNGSTANDGTGDSLRDAAGKINQNFEQLFSTVAVQTVTASVVATNDDGVFLVDATTADITINLPTAANNIGKTFTVKQINATNLVTIKGFLTETIDGNNEHNVVGFLGPQNVRLTMISNGVNWFLI